MKKTDWQKLAATAADPVRVRHFFDRLLDADAPLETLSADSGRALTALLAGSAALGNVLVAHPDWLRVLDMESLRFPRRAQGFQRELGESLKPDLAASDFSGALAAVRRFKQREMLRIAARDLARLGHVVEITREISDLADACLDAVWKLCRRQFVERIGEPWHQDPGGQWQRTEFCLLGLGKLGGQELNFSSDVDVLFLYSDEGDVFKEAPGNKKAPRPVMSNHRFFNKLAEAFIAEVSRVTPEGMLFRIDLRLRPEGDAGPLCRSLESCENYYAQWGQTWERMMLIKARGVTGDAGLAADFLEMIQPFRYPPSINRDVLAEIAALKERTEKEIVGAGELKRNVKLGRGGIREIEFVAQSLQILHAGRQPFLQTAQTLPCLAKLAQYKLLSDEEVQQLDAAYRFLRDIEHRLQMDEDQQTHTIPPDRPTRLRLARLMDFKSLPAFESALKKNTGNVRRTYDRLLKPESPKVANGLPRTFAGAEEEWKELLVAHSFRDPETAFRLLQEFAEGPGYVLVSAHTTELARRLIPRLLALCPSPDTKCQMPDAVLSDPDRVLTRLDSFVSAYGTRAPLLEMWSNHPAMFELMLLLFDRSEFLAEAAIRTPDLIDGLIVGGRLRQRKTALEILKDLRHGMADADQLLWLRRYHETEQMRLGLRDILGLADFEQNLAELSALADACLQYALEAVMRKNKFKAPPFVIIGLGKLGGREIDYGSDLDIVFVTNAREKELPQLQSLAVGVTELLSRRTEQGMVVHTDARLRPDGEKGLLVNTLAAYENYYRERAQLWEIQALVRTRPVAGNLELGGKFQELAATLTNFNRVSKIKNRWGELREPLTSRRCGTPPSEIKKVAALPACFNPDWKQEIHRMRMRIEKERTPPGQDDLALKTGVGGLMDAEFIAQVLCLENGWREANTLRALERARAAGVLPDAEKLLEHYRQLRRVEGILRRWSYEGETVLPDDPAPYYRVSVRCGFSWPEEFRTALAKWRKGIRMVYTKVFKVD